MCGPAADSTGRWCAFRRLACINRRLGATLRLDRTTCQTPRATTTASNEMHGVIAARPRVARMRDGVRPVAGARHARRSAALHVPPHHRHAVPRTVVSRDRGSVSGHAACRRHPRGQAETRRPRALRRHRYASARLAWRLAVLRGRAYADSLDHEPVKASTARAGGQPPSSIRSPSCGSPCISILSPATTLRPMPFSGSTQPYDGGRAKVMRGWTCPRGGHSSTKAAPP